MDDLEEFVAANGGTDALSNEDLWSYMGELATEAYLSGGIGGHRMRRQQQPPPPTFQAAGQGTGRSRAPPSPPI